ncbi:MAG: hypothetical protein ABI723_24150 [Bacteroidia bacterium]
MKHYLPPFAFLILNIAICSGQSLERFVVASSGDFQNNAYNSSFSIYIFPNPVTEFLIFINKTNHQLLFLFTMLQED